jgi:hypothetical protein
MNRPLQWKQDLTPGMPFVHHLAETPLGVVRIDRANLYGPPQFEITWPTDAAHPTRPASPAPSALLKPGG